MAEYEVGKYYRVPTVRPPGPGWGPQPIPILGPAHEDVEVIGFPNEHWHVDPRFMSDAQIKRYDGRRDAERVLAVPISIRVSNKASYAMIKKYNWDHRKEGELILIGVPPVIWRRRKCYRIMPPFPKNIYGDCAPWLEKLEQVYQDTAIKDLARPICPHRGIPLEGLACKDGVVECPGHGLLWDLRTGRLVPHPRPQGGR